MATLTADRLSDNMELEKRPPDRDIGSSTAGSSGRKRTARSRENHVLLLRHCLASPPDSIRVCKEGSGGGGHDDVPFAAFLGDAAKPLPDWPAPPGGCTRRGLDIVKDSLAPYVASLVLGSHHRGAGGGKRGRRRHVEVRVVTDGSRSGTDTAAALADGLEVALRTRVSSWQGKAGLTYDGLDRQQPAPALFSGGRSEDGSNDESSGQSTAICDQTEEEDEGVYREVSERLSRAIHDVNSPLAQDALATIDDPEEPIADKLEKSRWRFPKSINRADSIDIDGGVVADEGCRANPVGTFLSATALLAEHIFASRAARLDPPFLPDNFVEYYNGPAYGWLPLADRVRSVELAGNGEAAARGAVLAKSILAAAVAGEAGKGARRNEGGADEVVRLTVYVGSPADVYGAATALGLQWFGIVCGGDGVLSVPPGSGLLLSSADPDSGRTSSSPPSVQMRYIAPNVEDMINYARDKVSHSDEPVFLDDDRGGGTGCGDRTGGNVPLSRLQDRLDATVAKYPRLGECYEGVPVFLGLGPAAAGGERGWYYAATVLLITLIVAAGWVVIVAYRRAESRKGESVGVGGGGSRSRRRRRRDDYDNLNELELSEEGVT